MTPLVIILILIGAGIIVFSCFLIDKSDSSGYSNKTIEQIQEMTAIQMQEMKKSLNSFANDVMNETYDKADDKLSELANNKIIAVDDFSNQILAKISQNHEEVVFLYNMLNEKENQLKDLLKQVDGAPNISLQPVILNNDSIKNEANAIPNNKNNNAKKLKNDKKKDNISKADKKTNDNKINLILKDDMMDENNNNRKILELYSEGYSIVEISKMLELGQGEIKLVIDLFKE
ncbi:MAG: hypothetical protein K0S41_3233 [Anaerocolumna sp.]|jgi:hypothetical protein|nr:hypothetical protein [Anaerocolumna sp.]